jgi:hypothetical protein
MYLCVRGVSVVPLICSSFATVLTQRDRNKCQRRIWFAHASWYWVNPPPLITQAITSLSLKFCICVKLMTLDCKKKDNKTLDFLLNPLLRK